VVAGLDGWDDIFAWYVEENIVQGTIEIIILQQQNNLTQRI
tara:strand:- start:511 stop:633 length:123 start_codon:yes stop_codon:yes gene_type:complete